MRSCWRWRHEQSAETQDQPNILEPESMNSEPWCFQTSWQTPEHETEISTRQGEGAVGVDLTYEEEPIFRTTWRLLLNLLALKRIGSPQ